MDQRMASMENHIVSSDRRLINIENLASTTDRRFDSLNKKVDKLEEKYDLFEDKNRTDMEMIRDEMRVNNIQIENNLLSKLGKKVDDFEKKATDDLMNLFTQKMNDVIFCSWYIFKLSLLSSHSKNNNSVFVNIITKER